MITGGFVVVHLVSHIQCFVTPWTATHQAFLFFTISQCLLELISIESVMPSNHLLLCRPLLLLILWRIDFKNCESLYCIAVIYITLYINSTSTKKGIKKGTWKKKGGCLKKKSVCQLLLQNKFSFISGSHICGFCGELPLISWSQLGLWAGGFDLGMPHMSLFFFFFFWRLAGYAEHVLLTVKCRRPGEHLDSTSTSQVFIYIMSTDTSLAKANHMAKAKDKRWRNWWRRYICAQTMSTATNNMWMEVKWKSLSHVQLFATPRTIHGLWNKRLAGTNRTVCAPGPKRKEQWLRKRLTQTCPKVSRSLQQRHGQLWPAAGLGALSAAVHHGTFWRRSPLSSLPPP